MKGAGKGGWNVQINWPEGGVTKCTNCLEGGVTKLLPGLNMCHIYIDLKSLPVKIKEGGGLLSIYKYQPNNAYIISFVRSLKTGTSHKLRIQVKLNISSNFYNYSLCFLADRALQRLIT